MSGEERELVPRDVNSKDPAAGTIRVVVLGANGMLGHTLFRHLSHASDVEVYGSVRRPLTDLPPTWSSRLLTEIDAHDFSLVKETLESVTPDVIVNCVGVIKQASAINEAAGAMNLNGLLPHRLADFCASSGSRLIHVSTDCVFSGRKGLYSERDVPDPVDFYGRSKLAGEPVEPSALTLRTSIVGHELRSRLSLVDWFLSQKDIARGFTRAIYSGITTVEFAHLMLQVILPRPDLAGLYHVASDPISKYELLKLLQKRYAWPGVLVPESHTVVDRSLSADRLRAATGYKPPSWVQMVDEMADDRETGWDR